MLNWYIAVRKIFFALTAIFVWGLVLALPQTLAAQDFAADDTSDYYYEDYEEGDDGEGYFDEGEYYEEDEGYYDDEYSDDEYSEDEYYDDEYYEDEGEYSDEGDEFYEEDEYADDEYAGDEEEFVEDADLNLADDSAGEVELEEIEQPRIREPRVIRGYNIKLSVLSPWFAGGGLTSWWWSNIDIRVALDIPQRTKVGDVPLSYTFEVDTYSFVNQHPSGGQFKGVSILGLIRAPVGPLQVSAGGGIYGFENVSAGMVFGVGYSLPFMPRGVDLSVDSRLCYVMKSTPGGASYWMDIGGSFGILF